MTASGVEQTLAAFADGLLEILGGELVAVYVFGSAVAGDLEPASSDVDFLVITESRLDEASLDRLSAFHHKLAAEYEWGDRLDGGYAARDQLRPWGLEGSIAAIEPGQPLEAAVPAKHGPSNMLAIREAGRALVGPPPSAVVPKVDARTLERGVRGYLGELLARGRDDEEIDELAVRALDITRCVYALAHGRPSPLKGDAAMWLAREQPHLEPVLTAASAVRSGRADEHAIRVLTSGFPDLQTAARRLAGVT